MIVPWMAREFVSGIEMVPVDIIELIQNFIKVENVHEVDACYEVWIEYIKRQYENRNKNPREKQIYTHVTCAVDKLNMRKVFSDVRHIVVGCSLARGGLL